MVEEAQWRGLLADPRMNIADVALTAVVPGHAPGAGGSKPLLVVCSDNHQYWLKLSTSGQGPRIPENEQIVARCGELIGAPTCHVALVDVPPEHAGYSAGGGAPTLEAGIVHGSRHVANTVEERTLAHDGEDDNALRSAGVAALHDWCWGDDSQFLYDQSQEQRLYSHDHGHYLWNSGRTPDQLRANVSVPHPSPALNVPSVKAHLATFADRLEAISRDDIARVLNRIPAQWSVSSAELEVIGFFLEARIPGVVERLRSQT